MNNNKNSQEIIVNHLKNYGFVFPSSEIYGGIANTWDYGPLGSLLKNNIKNLWWSEYVTKTPNASGIDSAIILNPLTWKASGHLSNFSDPLVDCKKCKNRYRADNLINDQLKITISESESPSRIKEILDSKIKCPFCSSNNWTDVRSFNLMFKTHNGVIEEKKNEVYLRPETAQGIFTNFINVNRTTRHKLPFSICQIGKAFRNEITPGNFIFRTREFEQMECEVFCFPDDADKCFEEQIAKVKNFIFNILCFNKKNVELYEHTKKELSHYSSKTIDMKYNFPHGSSELWGIANRGDFDLQSHANASKANVWYLDEKTNKKIIPYVIEPSVGVDRLMYALCCDKYKEEALDSNDSRIVLAFPFNLAPYKAAILPLTNKLSIEAKKIFEKVISQNISATFDTSGSIGKRYRRQDAIGTPFCITFDYDSLEDKKVTIRDRDSMNQERILIKDVCEYLRKYV